MCVRELDLNMKDDFLHRIENVFGVTRTKAFQLFTLLKHCMEHRDGVSKLENGTYTLHISAILTISVILKQSSAPRTWSVVNMLNRDNKNKLLPSDHSDRKTPFNNYL